MSFLPASVAVLNNLRKYLLSLGWAKVEHPNARIEVLQSKPDGTGDFASVSIPSSPELRDASGLGRASGIRAHHHDVLGA